MSSDDRMATDMMNSTCLAQNEFSFVHPIKRMRKKRLKQTMPSTTLLPVTMSIGACSGAIRMSAPATKKHATLIRAAAKVKLRSRSDLRPLM